LKNTDAVTSTTSQSLRCGPRYSIFPFSALGLKRFDTPGLADASGLNETLSLYYYMYWETFSFITVMNSSIVFCY